MADIITRKSTRQVVLRPLDGSGRSFVLFGLSAERLQFNVASPTRRTVSQVHVTQQRRVGRRRYVVTISLFEPNIQASGRTGRLDRSSIYEQRGTGSSTKVPTRQQLEMIHSIAKLHEQGILISYSGISMATERAAIVEFNADVVYATGTGTLTIEERPEKQIDIENIAITVEAVENAQKKLEESGNPNGPSPLDLFGTDETNATDYLLLIHSFQAEVLSQASFTPYIPTEDQSILTQYGLSTQPVGLATDDGQLHIFPRDSTYRIPRLRILPLAIPSNLGGASEFNISIATQGLFIDFQFKRRRGGGGVNFLGVLDFGGSAGGDWDCTAWVFSDPIPLYEIRKEDKPIIDPKADPERLAPAQTDPRMIAFREENRGRFKDVPRHVISVKVEMGREVDLADHLTFAFMPKNSMSWDRPRNDSIKDWAIVLGDYRPTAA